MPEGLPSRGDVERQLQAILSSASFQRSPALSRFLEFTVIRTLEGRSEDIKEFVIGSEVLGRGSSFDPRVDTIVRTQAHRLRALLQAYYATEPSAPVLIEFAKGAYVPTFRITSSTTETPDSGSKPGALPQRPRIRRLMAAAAVSILLLAGASLLFRRPGIQAPKPVPALFNLDLSPEGGLDVDRGTIVFSPSGRSVLFPLVEAGGARRLWIRSLQSGVSRALAGTDSSYLPFWSPDEAHFGFFQAGRLKIFRLADGSIRDLTDAPLGRGGAWAQNGVILFAPQSSGRIYQIREQGDGLAPATEVDPRRGENDHRWPEFLPDGRRFIYSVRARTEANNSVMLGSLDSRKVTMLLSGNNSQSRLARTEAGDFLLYVRDGAAWAVPFDTKTGRLTGGEQLLVQGVRYSNVSGATFSFAGGQFLAYHGSESQLTSVQLYDRAGHIVKELTPPDHHLGVTLDAAGEMIAIEMGGQGRQTGELWIGRRQNFSPVRFTFSGGAYSAWSGDGSTLYYLRSREGSIVLTTKRTSPQAEEAAVWSPPRPIFPTHVSKDGRWLVFHEDKPDTLMDLALLPLDPIGYRVAGPPVQVRASKFNETHGFLSNDGRYIAYVSDESGRLEVYVTEIAGSGKPGQTWKASTQGGSHPRWRGDDGELYYLAPSRALMAVRMEKTDGGLRIGAPVKLFDTLAFGAGDSKSPYFPGPDGRTFFINALHLERAPAPIRVISGWTGLLKEVK